MAKKETELSKQRLVWGLAFVLVAGLLIGYFVHSTMPPVGPVCKLFAEKDIEEQRLEWIDEANTIRANLAAQGKYRCCIEKPCWYCIQKSPGHGEGATCTCIDDILAGRHPCGECIGEILEGHGEPSLVKYFAKAIAEKVGEQHTDHLKEMIADLYGVSVDEQV